MEKSKINLISNTTALALHVCSAYTQNPCGIAIDATCGNGHDTLWLSEKFDKVYAFDIQKEAIENTRKLLAEHCKENVILINDSHCNMAEYIKADRVKNEQCIEQSPALIIFNLGYLPGKDKAITTKADETLKALKSSLEILAKGGLLSITMYPGHEEGRKEKEAIISWAKTLSKSSYHCVRTDMLNQPETAPEILWITKK